jgi:hypothetical protein
MGRDAKRFGIERLIFQLVSTVTWASLSLSISLELCRACCGGLMRPGGIGKFIDTRR